jgi:hypothetical protein
MMIVYERNGANHCRTGTGRPLCNQAISDQITEGLGPVGVAQPRNEIIESFEKIRIERDSDSAKDAHYSSFKEIRK